MESEKANNLPNNSKFHPTLKYLVQMPTKWTKVMLRTMGVKTSDKLLNIGFRQGLLEKGEFNLIIEK